MLPALLAVWLAAAGADLILHHGRIVTVDPSFSIQAAVSIRGGRISLVGSNEAVLAGRGPDTRVIDLHGRTVLPGLIDAHVHPFEAALSEYREKLPKFDSYAAVQAWLREQARKTPPGKWIVVPRTFPTRLAEMRMPTKDVLDVVTSHPVMFDASYVSILNSRGLAECGITRDTPDPPGGEIGHEANGEPNGILRNAGDLVHGADTGPNFTGAEKLQALEQMLGRYIDAGFTAVGDRAVTPEIVRLYQTLHARGRLPLRVVMTWRLPAAPPLDELRRTIGETPWTTNQGDDWLKFGTFKVTLDGGMTIGTAYQRDNYGPFGKQLYGQSKPGRGQLFIAPDKLYGILDAARAMGWQMTAHDQGGGAVDNMLDAFEKLDRARPIAPTRSHLMHASFMSAAAIERTKRLGLLADVQAAWLNLDGPALEKVFLHDGMRWFFPLRSYLDAGIVIAGGSDHMIGHDKDSAVNPYNPFFSLWVEVTRRMNDGRVLYPEQRISRAEALKTYTISAAYLQFAEKTRGSIEPGKFADLVMIDRDYLACPEDDIRKIQPLMVVLDGKIVRGPLY